MYDLIIIGGGPAGVAAAVYAARKQLKTFIAGRRAIVVSEALKLRDAKDTGRTCKSQNTSRRRKG
jgi:thioredoxin reductase